MLSLRALVLGSLAAFSMSAVNAISVPRQIEDSGSGTIVAPASGATIQAGTSYDFDFEAVNFCEDGFLNFDVYLLNNPNPQFSDLNSQGQFTEFLVNYGTFTVAEFGQSLYFDNLNGARAL